MTEQIVNLLKSGLDYVYGDQWDNFAEGFGGRAVVEGVGILVTYDDDVVKISAGVFSGLNLDENLLARVTDVCIGTRIGSFYLSHEDGGNTWCLIYAIKLPMTWIDPSSKASVQMLGDMLANTPELVNSRAGYITQNAGVSYSRWPVDADTWWFTLMNHC